MRPLLVSLALGLAACQSPTAPAGSPPDHGGPDHGPAYSDVRFLDDMTAHHRMAVEMAAEARTRARAPEVSAMTEGMLRDQEAEIREMAAIRQALGGDAAPHGPADMARMGMAAPMDSLTSAADFDRAFLRMMVPHHAGAVVMAAEAEARSGRPDVRALARRIVDAQALEIGEMQRALSPSARSDSSAG